MRRPTVLRYAAATAWISSAIVHAGAFAALGMHPRDHFVARPPATVDFQVVAPPVEPPIEEPRTVEESPLVRESRVPLRSPDTTVARPVAPAPPAPEAPVPLDLTGITLTSGADDVAWVSAVEKGQSLASSFGVPRPAAAPKPSFEPPSTVTRDEVVPSRDLSRPPVAPNLDGVLSRYYPEDARRRGVAGRATVRLRISSAGRVVRVIPLDESDPGFADACTRAVNGSIWSAPRDRHGRAVVTEVKYVCRFRVE